MFRPEDYVDEDIIYVKKKPIRQSIAKVLGHHAGGDPARLERFVDTGLISPRLLQEPAALALLDKLERDLMRTAKPANEIRNALAMSDPRSLLFSLRVVPPPDGGPKDQWFTVDRLVGASGMPHDTAHAGFGPQEIEGLAPGLQTKLSDNWQALADAWRSQDAPAASAALARLAEALPSVNPGLYPDAKRLFWESWYFRYKNMTWVWMIYLLAVIPLLMSVIYKWGWARVIGIVLFVIAFAFHTSALGLRWYVAQRWPNSNMFEAVTTATWFGGIVALILEFVVRRTPLRNLFALGSAAASLTALMAAYYMPVQLNAQIGNKMPVLHDVWLYIHTNVIIASYCLIAMAAVSALLYLGYRGFAWFNAGDGAFSDAARIANAGGAGSLILSGGPAGSFIKNPTRTTAGQVLDAATMVLMELAFILLWAGLVMGAIWADHSWGRPWGWDPKEVFALNTFIIFLLLVHVRLKVRDKGFWTAILAVTGCGVMLFNWIVVNFVITGLHSYA
jgi:cytochrome c-type biogenesis protein CcsB